MKTALGAVLAIMAFISGAAAADWTRWPEVSRAVAARMIDEYGAPDKTSSDALEWGKRGPWRSITVHRGEDFTRRAGVLEQAVRFDTPPSRWHDLAGLGFGVSYDPAKHLLKASAESEEVNFLALNTAVDVIRKRRTVMAAREFYRKTLDLQLSGKSSRYTKGLLFEPAKELPPSPAPPMKAPRLPLRP